jgi:D-alanyl-lipoteichoic acid acyltransferase DltB (MBOAT superfamily)
MRIELPFVSVFWRRWQISLSPWLRDEGCATLGVEGTGACKSEATSSIEVEVEIEVEVSSRS